MGADDRSDTGNQRNLFAVFILQDILQHLGIFNAVGVGDEDRGIRPDRLTQLFRQLLDGLFPSVHLSHLDQVAFVIHMKHRFHVQGCTQQGCGCADPSAALQVNQVFHCKPVAHMGYFFPECLRVFFQCHSGIPVFHGKIYEQAFTGGSGKRIDRFDLSVRILSGKPFSNLFGIFTGHAQSAGQAQVKDILSCLKNLGKCAFKSFFIDTGGFCNSSCTHGFIELINRFFMILLLRACICKKKSQRKHFYIPFCQFVRMNITSGVGIQHIILSHFFPSCHHCRRRFRQQ